MTSAKRFSHAPWPRCDGGGPGANVAGKDRPHPDKDPPEGALPRIATVPPGQPLQFIKIVRGKTAPSIPPIASCPILSAWAAMRHRSRSQSCEIIKES
jgi:hypothetical protein